MTNTHPTFTAAEWRDEIVVTLTGADHARFHRLSSGEVVDDQGRGGADFVPAWVVDSLTPNVRPATSTEIVAALASSGTLDGGFLDLLRRRTAVVETVTGPSWDDDVPRLEEIADLERRMIASPPRSPDEIAEALAVVRAEIVDGFLGSDTIEEFLVMIVEAAADFLINRRPPIEHAPEGDAQILDLSAEWRETLALEWPGTPEAADEICLRLGTIEERLGGLVPSTPAGAAAMIGIIIQRDEPVPLNDCAHRILRAAAAGLTRMNTGELPA